MLNGVQGTLLHKYFTRVKAFNLHKNYEMDIGIFHFIGDKNGAQRGEEMRSYSLEVTELGFERRDPAPALTCLTTVSGGPVLGTSVPFLLEPASLGRIVSSPTGSLLLCRPLAFLPQCPVLPSATHRSPRADIRVRRCTHSCCQSCVPLRLWDSALCKKTDQQIQTKCRTTCLKRKDVLRRKIFFSESKI